MRRCGNLMRVHLAGAVLLACIVFGWDKANGAEGVPWPATDGLGRAAPVGAEVGPLRANRTVGMFYFLWLTGLNAKSPRGDGPFGVSRILAADPRALDKPDSPLWGPIGTPHYWGEPLYGYYQSDDAWVLRRHAYLLADAGIDVLVFDTTNTVTYKNIYMKLCEVFAQIRSQGEATPRIAFMVNTTAADTADTLHRDLYAPGLFRDLWFEWQGKPLMICDPQEASPAVREFFTLRKAHWPFQMINTPNAWHWEATYPQPYGYTDAPGRAEQVSVSVAQNLRASDGLVTNMSRLDARGRSFHDGREETGGDAVARGLNFEEQWRRARELEPPFVLVTGWNEWIAGRFGQPAGPIEFVDQFSEEFSRDIEPMRGGHGDNYYYQLVSNVRRYKGAAPLPTASPAKTIRIEGDFDAWRDVAPEFKDHVGETAPRDHDGAAGLHYANHTGRNDFETLKVARDADNIYFYARTREAIRAPAGAAGMWLLIDADQNPATGWQGFDVIVNRVVENGVGWLERNNGDWNWQRVGPVKSRVSGREIQIAVPRVAGADCSRHIAGFQMGR